MGYRETVDGEGEGAVYVYRKDASGIWTVEQKLRPADIDQLGSVRFGGFVALDGDRAVVGSRYGAVNGVSRAGAAYLYERGGEGAWLESQRLQAEQPVQQATFGSVGIWWSSGPPIVGEERSTCFPGTPAWGPGVRGC